MQGQAGPQGLKVGASGMPSSSRGLDSCLRMGCKAWLRLRGPGLTRQPQKPCPKDAPCTARGPGASWWCSTPPGRCTRSYIRQCAMQRMSRYAIEMHQAFTSASSAKDMSLRARSGHMAGKLWRGSSGSVVQASSWPAPHASEPHSPELIHVVVPVLQFAMAVGDG